MQLALCSGGVCGGSQWCVCVLVCVLLVCVYTCACGRMGMLYVALCSGADAKYINVLNLHRLQCIYINTGNKLTKCPFSYFNIYVMQSSSIYGPNSHPPNILPVV